jgi:hypothetical protein
MISSDVGQVAPSEPLLKLKKDWCGGMFSAFLVRAVLDFWRAIAGVVLRSSRRDAVPAATALRQQERAGRAARASIVVVVERKR